MPRYHFHGEDGQPLPDRIGMELPDDDAARRRAILVLAELLREDPELFWRDECFRLTVADPKGLTLFILELSVVTSAAAGVRRPGPGRS